LVRKEKNIMIVAQFSGPYTLEDIVIDLYVAVNQIGVYVLGNTILGTFVPKYVGRSDVNLNGRLKDWVGYYSQFKFGYYSTQKDAYSTECWIYHQLFPSLDNERHPDKPIGKDYKCPWCGE